MRGSTVGYAALLIFVTALLAGCTSAPPPPPPLASWVELVPGGMLSVRAITEAPACPQVEIDGKASAMTERAGPDPTSFPVRACEATAPQSAQSVRVNGRDLPVLHHAIKRIVVFGDTGCRLKGAEVQLCNDPKAWPFAQVTAAVAARHPDLVIHVGDYHYRETACPAGMACVGPPSGDNWGVWNADFFQPAAPLLAAAPWVMVRGNHETCGRGGKGWFRFIDASATVLDCPAMVDPFAISLDGLSLLVTDSASTDDAKVTPGVVDIYAQGFKKVASGIQGPFWVLTHRPVWGLAPRPSQNGKPVYAPLNSTEQAAIDPAIPSNLDMVVSGHVHTFASYDFGGARPAQLVAGVGGSQYDKMELPAGSPVEIDGKTAHAFATTEYGYLVMDRTQGGWDGTLYAVNGDRVLAHCAFRGRSVDCR